MTMTTRQYEILSIVLEGEDFITMSSLAHKLGLSARTIQRELDSIRVCLEKGGRLIEIKSGSGVRFCGNMQERTQIKEKMGCLERLRPVYSQEKRVWAILLDLLTEREPKKIFSFTRDLGITETTVGTDLNVCEKWLSDNGISLIRKPGVGIYIETDEWLRRRALLRLYYEQSDKRSEGSKESDPSPDRHREPADIRKLFNSEKLEQIEAMLSKVSAIDGIIQNDCGRKTLAVHLYLILMRVRQGASIMSAADTPACDDSANVLADTLITALEEKFNLRIPCGERTYLATILRSARGLSYIPDSAAERQAERIATNMIMQAEELTGVMIDPNGGFHEALRKHLIPTIARLSMGLDIRNPILKDIKEHYGEHYELARKCAAALAEELHVEVPESEIGYLAVHLGVALEDSRSYYSRRCRAVVCCPSGLITAQLLALRVNREFSDIETVDVVSTVNLDYDRLENESIDMIISTVCLPDARIPSVRVSPFLSDEEKDAVWQLLKSCRSGHPRPAKKSKLADLATTLAKARGVIDTILQVLSNLFLWEDQSIESVDALINRVAAYTADTAEGSGHVRADLIERERYGSTIVRDQRTMLLHCRTDGVSKAWFGVVRPGALSHRHNGENTQIETVLVMLAPKSASRPTFETLGALSRSVVEDDAVMQALREGGRKACYDTVERVLNTYYYEMTNQQGEEYGH